MKSHKRLTAVLAIAVVIVCVLYFMHAKTKPETAPQERPVQSAAPAKVSEVRQAAKKNSDKLKLEQSPEKTQPAIQKAVRVPIPKPGTNAKHKVWVNGKYGPGENELGRRKGGGEASPQPKGFTITKDGNLLVLDTLKQRLVYYDKEGQIERTVSLEKEKFVIPVDVDITKDDTVAVLDDDVVQPRGLVLFDSEGNIKADFPKVVPAPETAGLYAVGNDFYLDNQFLGSMKVAQSDGKILNESKDLYTQENGMVPGRIAPDGVTVVSAGIDNRDTGEFFVTVIRGKQPEHIFTRFYLVPPQLLGIDFAAADGQGRLYVVLYYTGKLFLACLEGENGDPVGQVEMPLQSGDDPGRPFRRFRVVESGGLLYQVMSDEGSSYEWFDCHP
jgi:hypothetical protein